MLRLLFVYLIAATGYVFSLQSPYYALLFYTWNAYFRPESWVWQPTVHLVAALKISLISGWITLIATLLARKKLVWNGRATLLLVFLAFSYLTVLKSEYYEYCFEWWSDFAKCIIISYLYLVLVTDVPKLRLLIVVMALSLGLEGAKQAMLGLIREPGATNTNPIVFLGDNNGVAVGMLMLVPIMGLLAQTVRREKPLFRWRKRFYWLLAFGVLYRAIATYSRGGMLAGVGLVSVYWWRSQHRIRGLFAVVAATAAILSVMPESWWARMETTFAPEEHEDRSALSRFHFWKVALAMAQDNPVLGVGFNGYNMSYDSYDFEYGLYGNQRAVHSSWLGVLAECGFVGAGLYAAIMLAALSACSKVKRKAREDPRYEELAKYATALQAAFAAVLVGGAFVNFQYNEMLWNFVGLSMVLHHFVTRKSYEEIFPAAATPQDVVQRGGTREAALAGSR